MNAKFAKLAKVAGALTLVFAASTIMAKSDFTEQFELASGDIEKFNIDVGAGELTVTGSKGIDEIQVVAKVRDVYADDKDYELYLRVEGDEAILYSRVGRNYMGSSARIDIEVTMPDNLPLTVEDKSGDVRISNLNSGLQIRDGSGDMKIKTISGEVTVIDGSGDIKLTTINGPLTIDDGSGDMDIVTVNGDVSIDDNSGDIEVETVNGNLEVDDGSGQIELRDVSGYVTASDNSGDIYVDGAAGFNLRSDGSGDVDLENIRDEK